MRIKRSWPFRAFILAVIVLAMATTAFAASPIDEPGTKMIECPDCATLGVVLPSFLIISLVARCFARFRSSPIVQGGMSGLRPAVVGLIAAAVVSVGLTVFFPGGVSLDVVQTPGFLVALGVFLLSLLLAFRKAHPIFIICLSGLLGCMR